MYRPVGPRQRDRRRRKLMASLSLPVRWPPCGLVTSSGPLAALDRCAVAPGASGRRWTGPGHQRTRLRPSSLWSSRTQRPIGLPHLALPVQGLLACSPHAGRRPAAGRHAVAALHRPSWISVTAWRPVPWHPHGALRLRLEPLMKLAQERVGRLHNVRPMGEAPRSSR